MGYEFIDPYKSYIGFGYHLLSETVYPYVYQTNWRNLK